ncbi:MAG: MBL fold metallo-hydrolase, partial [Coxiellaceae bacterium]|nr:MBL fold metallo-hydrolase [Coxiellaceae bacterium]
MQITFLGATETVTGSKYLLTHNNKRVLIDCGLFQGYKELRLRNWAKLPIDPESIDAVLLTHAHIDHSGYIPLLVKNGFKGPIFATEATFDLCKILLPDSGHLQEEDAKRANLYGYTKHKPALPLYTRQDALDALEQFDTVEFARIYPILDGFKVSWHRAGHILGAAMIMVEFDNKKCVFTGDLGRPNDPVMKPPVTIQETDYLVTESTYGNRLHEQTDPKELLKTIINRTTKRGGTVLIPSFAVGRAQMLLYELYLLKLNKDIPDIPIYLDSPMAIDATKLFYQHAKEHRLSKDIALEVCKIATYTNTTDESKAIDNNPMPKVVISASGMMTGGRVLHHLRVFAPDAK